MQMSDELKARLHHGAQELRQSLQLLASISDRTQTAIDEIQVCNDRADLIDPAIDTLNQKIHTLNAEVDRVYALSNDKSDSYLKQENVQLKRDLEAVQQALRLEVEQRQAHLTDSVKSHEELVQHIQSLEQFNSLLISKINETREKYESAIVEVTELKSTPASKDIANTALSGNPNDGSPEELIPFGKTVVETNRGLTVTIESSPNSSPEKASLHHGWIPQVPSNATIPFPEIAPLPQLMSPALANRRPTQVVIRAPGRSKSRPMVRGTQEANESFQRMMRTLNSSSLADSAHTVNDNSATAASSLSSSGPAKPIIRPSAVHPIMSGQVKSKLNPAVEAFTPSDSSGKDLVKSGGMQASSPTKNEITSSVITSTNKEDGFIPPHLRRFPKISIQEEPVVTTEQLSAKDKIKDHRTVATSSLDESKKEAEPLQATSLTPRILPHLRRLTNEIKKEDVHQPQVQLSAKGEKKADSIMGTGILSLKSALTDMKENIVKSAMTPGAFVRPGLGLQAWLDSQEKAQSSNAPTHESASINNDMLIDIDAEGSPKAGKVKTVPLPPGFIPISTKEAPAKTEAATPIKIDSATSPIAAHEPVTYRDPTVENKGAAPRFGVSAKAISEKENNAAFVAEYNRKLSSVSEKYGRDSRTVSDANEDGVDPIKYGDAELIYIPSKPTGTREMGALLDDECYRMVLKPRRVVKEVPNIGPEWKALNKNGKVVYVL